MWTLSASQLTSFVSLLKRTLYAETTVILLTIWNFFISFFHPSFFYILSFRLFVLLLLCKVGSLIIEMGFTPYCYISIRLIYHSNAKDGLCQCVFLGFPVSVRGSYTCLDDDASVWNAPHCMCLPMFRLPLISSFWGWTSSSCLHRLHLI